MPTKSRILTLILGFSLSLILAQGIVHAKSGLDSVEYQLNSEGIEVPDLLGPIDVWEDGGPTLRAIKADTRLRNLYQTASAEQDFVFPVMLGNLILVLLVMAPHTAWPQRMQAWPTIIEGAQLIGVIVIVADLIENHYANAYLDLGDPAKSLVLFQTASTLKWLLIGASFTLIVGLYFQWARRIIQSVRGPSTT